MKDVAVNLLHWTLCCMHAPTGQLGQWGSSVHGCCVCSCFMQGVSFNNKAALAPRCTNLLSAKAIRGADWVLCLQLHHRFASAKAAVATKMLHLLFII